MKTKLCFFIQTLNGGGAERVVVTILRQLDYEKYEVDLVMSSATGPLLQFVPKQVNIVDLGKSRTILSLLSLRNHLRKTKPNIVFSSLIRTHGVLYLAARMAGINPKIILRSPNSPEQYVTNKRLNWLTAKLLNNSYRNCDLIIAQTAQMKEEISHYHNIPKSNIAVMSNPIDTDNIDVMTASGENPFNNGRINVVASGRIVEQKGFDFLIQSFSMAFAKNSNLLLNIIGEDGMGLQSKLEEQAAKLGITDHIVFWGFQTNPYKFYKNADLFILSSRWEGMPNTVIENIYLQKRIIATKCIDYIEELIIDKKNGILVEVNDEAALAKAILDFETIDASNDILSINHKTSGFNSILESYSA